MPAGVSAWTPLANITLGSSAASVTFSSISQSYRDLVVVITGVAGVSNDHAFQLNGDTTVGNYSHVYMGGNGSTTFSSTTGNGNNIAVNSYWDTTNRAMLVMNFMDYSATDKHKTAIWSSDKPAGATERFCARWANTAAVTSLKFLGVGSATFAAGSTFALYGVSA